MTFGNTERGRRSLVCLRAHILDVKQAKDLTSGGAEVHMVAAGMPELGNPGRPQRRLQPIEFCRPELDPRSTKRVVIVEWTISQFGGSSLAELDTEATSVTERHEQDRMVESEVQLPHVATQDVAEERDESVMGVRAHE